MENLVKIILIGDSGVGKSSLLLRYIKNMYDNNYLATIGIDFYVKRFMIDEIKYKLHIYDLAGQEIYKSIVNTFYRHGKGILLLFDITNRQSFKSLDIWIENIKTHSIENPVIFLIGTKTDLTDIRKISYDEAKNFADNLGIDYYEISSKNNINIQDIFINLAQKVKIQTDIEQEIYNKKTNINITNKEINYKCCN